MKSTLFDGVVSGVPADDGVMGSSSTAVVVDSSSLWLVLLWSRLLGTLTCANLGVGSGTWRGEASRTWARGVGSSSARVCRAMALRSCSLLEVDAFSLMEGGFFARRWRERRRRLLRARTICGAMALPVSCTVLSTVRCSPT